MRTINALIIGITICVSSPTVAWQITGYHTQMDVQEDSSILVTEQISTDFTGDPHHGIFREIPLSGSDRYGNNYRIRAKILEVTDENGSTQNYKTSMAGGRVRIKIGDADVYIEGPKTYVISYKLMRAVHFFSDHDELYWNVVGPEWQVPVQNATCTVTIPSGAEPGRIQTACYTGVLGSTDFDGSSDIPDERTARFWMSRDLNPGEYMTVVVGWEKKLVTRPSFWQETQWFVTDNGYFLLPIIFAVGLYLLWLRAGRDPDTGRSMMVTYDPPNDLSPAEIGTLIDEKVDMRDISASIIHLAVRGFITIESEKIKGFLSSRTEHTLRLTSSYSDTRSNPELSSYDRALMQALFSGKDFCIVSNLANSFYASIPALRDELQGSMLKRGYFNRRPDEVRKGYRIVGVAMIVAGVAGGIFLLGSGFPVGWLFALSVCGLLLAAAARLMPRKTANGKNALLAVKGFEEYLSRAEKQEIEYQERQGYFEKFLPYAMALGIADKWAQAFDGLQIQPPRWYGGYEGAFHPTIFAHDLDIATSDWGRAMTSQPRSSGGGSGFSGGSSGCGGGGGGGGAW